VAVKCRTEFRMVGGHAMTLPPPLRQIHNVTFIS